MSNSRRPSRKFATFWALTIGLLIATAAAPATLDVTNKFAIVSSASGPALNRATNTYDATFVLKNTSGAPILAPIVIVIGGLTDGVTLANKTGTSADGKPYVSL